MASAIATVPATVISALSSNRSVLSACQVVRNVKTETALHRKFVIASTATPPLRFLENASQLVAKAVTMAIVSLPRSAFVKKDSPSWTAVASQSAQSESFVFKLKLTIL